MNEITIKGDTPSTTVAMLLSLARPHFIAPARNDNVGTAPAPVTQTATAPLLPPTPIPDETIAPQLRVVQPTEQADPAPATDTTKSRRGRPAKAKTAIAVKWPDGSEKSFEAANDALEGMADALDLCDSKADVEKFLNDNVTVIEQASDSARDALTTCANDRIQEILKNDAAEGGTAIQDDFPQSQLPGDQKTSSDEPDDLKLPTFLDRKAAADTKIPSLEYFKKVFLKFSELNPRGVNGAKDALIAAGSTKNPPNLSSVPEANRAACIAEMRKFVPVDAVPEE